VRFLLALIFKDPGPSGLNESQTIHRVQRKQQRPETKDAPLSMEDRDEIAKRLSALGKVTVRPRE
jgi:hypothetical protein